MDPSLRANLHAALAEVFDEPREAFLARSVENPLLTAVGELAIAGEGAPFTRLFDRVWDEFERLPERSVAWAALQQDHARLFVVPSPQRLHPYEHEYARRPYSRLEPELAAAYREAGMGRSGSFKDLLDHISLEHEFVAHRLRSGHVPQAGAFLGQHLGSFALSFARDLASREPSPVYAVAADVLATFTSWELEGSDTRAEELQ